ncbi:MAG: hypothetical protein RJB26_2266 [Pseudomonadota bacterium]
MGSGRGVGKRIGRVLWGLLLALAGTGIPVPAGAATSLLFIGNSFTFGWGSPVQFYRAQSVTDLNGQGIGGVPALFKVFTVEAGQSWDVFLETQPGMGLDWHYANRREVLAARPWDHVTMMGYSLLDRAKPGDPALLVQSTQQMAVLLHGVNPRVDIQLEATFPRADQLYEAKGHWFGKSVDEMVHDIRAGYDLAAVTHPAIHGVVPVGEAWALAIRTGVADANPYDGLEAGKVNLWTYDHYHASAFGYYLKALVMFGHFTGQDPRTLGANECAAYELGFSAAQAAALQQVAFDQLASTGRVKAAAMPAAAETKPQRCPAPN